MLIKLKNLSYFIFIAFVITSCNPKDNTPANKYLQESILVKTETKEEFKTNLSNALGAQASQLTLFTITGVKKYKITYNTTSTDGTEISASGALIVPTDIKTEMALGSYQHGTIFDDSGAPSNFNDQSEVTLGSFFASTGIIIAMPDYVGYGVSKNLPHPYEHNLGLAQANVDFLLAVKEFLNSENISWNKRLMLAGYSEGGYATMSTLKLLEEKYPSDFNIVAASCGAGAYNKTGTFSDFISKGTSGEATNNKSYLWVLLTYDRIYKWNKPMTYYFKEPYASQVQKDGFNTSISLSFDKILADDFKNSFINKTDTKLIQGVAENDIYNWKPKTELRLYHGNADTYVPFSNTQTAFDQMKKNGATQVSINVVDKGTHGSSVGEFFLGTFEFFSSKKANP